MADIKLPPIPDETFDAGGPIWGRILDWGAAEPGHAAGEHADAIDAAITRVMHDHAREAVRLNAQAVTDTENILLRQMLAIRVGGALLYTDDGELQDNSTNPCIDFKRDPAHEIHYKLKARAAAPQPASGWTPTTEKSKNEE